MKSNDKLSTAQWHWVRLPSGELYVDPEALRRARQGVPKGDLHVDPEVLRRASKEIPKRHIH